MILHTDEPKTGSLSTPKLAEQPLSQSKPRPKRFPFGWMLLGLLLASLGGSGLLIQRQLQQQRAERLERLTVPVQVVDLTQRLRVSGQVQPLRQVNVSPRESGRLAELLVDQGDEVVAGQLLARMDYGDLASGIRQAQARIQEGGKERVQAFEGTVIAMRHSGINRTITVRKVFQGIGVERVFLIHSPRIESIQVLRRGKVRRAKLFYLRDRVGKATRIKAKTESADSKEQLL